jgi:hypothetical protein
MSVLANQITAETIAAELREAKIIALQQRDLTAVKAVNNGLKRIGDDGRYTEAEEQETALIVELDAVKTALYRHFNKDGTLLYVGISLSVIERLRQHRQDSHWYEDIARIEITWFSTRSEALSAERKAIESEGPLHNTIFNKGAA